MFLISDTDSVLIIPYAYASTMCIDDCHTVLRPDIESNVRRLVNMLAIFTLDFA